MRGREYGLKVLLPISLVLLVLAGWLAGCKPSTTGTTSSSPPPAAKGLELTFVYGSEKKKWIDAATASFNAAAKKTSAGKQISVKTLPMGSGELLDAVVSGRVQADMVSPASGAFIKLVNNEAKAKGEAEIIGATDNLVLSPVVIAMWKPMALALGWSESKAGAVGMGGYPARAVAAIPTGGRRR